MQRSVKPIRRVSTPFDEVEDHLAALVLEEIGEYVET